MRNSTIRTALLLTTLMLGQASYSHAPVTEKNETYYWMKFKAKDKFERTQITNLGVTIEAIVEDSVMALGTAAHLEKAKQSGKLEMNFPLRPEMLDFPPEDSNFHNYSELIQALQSLAAQNPELVKLSSLGRSLEGREIPLITISTDANDLSRPAIFFMGGHHAREHISVETPLKLAQYLAREYVNGNQRIVEMIKNRTIYIAPLINPDGAEYDVASGRYKMWRKNRRQNSARSYGVDLNRNYGYGWGGSGSSSDADDDIYRGTSAFSEPETQAVKAFFETHKNINIALSFHTFSQLILYPWGHKYDSIENQNDLMVHKTMAETMARWNGYTPQQSSDLYIASGDTTDWAYGQLGIISFTFELDPKSARFSPDKGFYPGQGAIEPTFRKNIEPCLYLIEYSDNPYRVIQPKALAYGLSSPIF